MRICTDKKPLVVPELIFTLIYSQVTDYCTDFLWHSAVYSEGIARLRTPAQVLHEAFNFNLLLFFHSFIHSLLAL